MGAKVKIKKNKPFILGQLPIDTLAHLNGLVRSYYNFSKQEQSEGWLVSCLINKECSDITSEEDEPKRTLPTKAAPIKEWPIEVDTPLSESDARELVVLVDFMTSAIPDNVDHTWCEKTAKLTALLRKKFHSSFGKTIYA